MWQISKIKNKQMKYYIFKFQKTNTNMKKVILLTLSSALILIACSRKTVPAKETGATSATKKTENTEPGKVATPLPVVADIQPATPNDLSLAENGKIVYNAKCGRCHDLKNAADYTAERWEKILEQMAPKAKLTDDEKKQVAAFVNANCKK
jgi:cytochrome c5